MKKSPFFEAPVFLPSSKPFKAPIFWHLGHRGKIDADREERPIMSALNDLKAAGVAFTDSSLVVDLQDGRSLSVPLDWYPKLRDASPEQRADHRLIGNGIGIHWESLGIDLSTQGLILDSPPNQDEHSKPKRVSYHVVPTGDEWHLKRQGEDRFTSFETKTEAIRSGVKEARSHKAGQLIIHKQNGQFQEERTYGFDPPGRAG